MYHVVPVFIINLIVFAVCCLFQNAAFTWSSRSRNSGDPKYHRKAAWASNGVYFMTNALLTLFIMKFASLPMLVLQGLVYTIAASEGSVYMMRQLLAREQGKRKVGNQFTDAEAAALRSLLKDPTSDAFFQATGNIAEHSRATDGWKWPNAPESKPKEIFAELASRSTGEKQTLYRVHRGTEAATKPEVKTDAVPHS